MDLPLLLYCYTLAVVLTRFCQSLTITTCDIYHDLMYACSGIYTEEQNAVMCYVIAT